MQKRWLSNGRRHRAKRKVCAGNMRQRASAAAVGKIRVTDFSFVRMRHCERRFAALREQSSHSRALACSRARCTGGLLSVRFDAGCAEVRLSDRARRRSANVPSLDGKVL
jgi:hypothetical protein